VRRCQQSLPAHRGRSACCHPLRSPARGRPASCRERSRPAVQRVRWYGAPGSGRTGPKRLRCRITGSPYIRREARRPYGDDFGVNAVVRCCPGLPSTVLAGQRAGYCWARRTVSGLVMPSCCLTAASGACHSHPADLAQPGRTLVGGPLDASDVRYRHASAKEAGTGRQQTRSDDQ
jgi:hypothetical protein